MLYHRFQDCAGKIILTLSSELTLMYSRGTQEGQSTPVKHTPGAYKGTVYPYKICWHDASPSE